MAEEEQGQTNQEAAGVSGGSSAGTAMKAAAAAAATGVAALAARKALSGRGHQNGSGKNASSANSDSESIFSSMLTGGWEAARDSLLPAAEHAAEAAGEFLAQNGPEVIRERIVPRFIESFNQASGES